MSFANLTEAHVAEIISAHLSPSAEIQDPDRLIGREKSIQKIRRALNSPNRHIFIHSERGVGKTSLAKTTGQLLATDPLNLIYVDCGEDTTFGEVIQRIGKSVLTVNQRLVHDRGSFGGAAGFPGLGNVSMNIKPGNTPIINIPSTTSEAYDILHFVRSKRAGQVIVVIDEFDRVRREQKVLFAELVKNIGTQIDDFRLMICGIGANVEEILGAHGSTGRMFETVEIDKLSHDKLWEIVQGAVEPLGVTVDKGILTRIGIISDGFPHFVHLIGECLIYAMLDDENVVSVCKRDHFETALTEALEKTEPYLRQIYSTATQKTKLQKQYEDSLWALADRTETRRKLDDIVKSYLRIGEQRRKSDRYQYGGEENTSSPPMTRYQLNQRLLTLRKDNHANIVLGHGSGWFSFREGVMRGYVRLRAETEGIRLSEEIVS